jgi:hypothetical protein
MADMHNYVWKHGKILVAGLALAVLIGCNAKPYNYRPTAGEMKQGPGLLSGDDGEFTLYDSKKGEQFSKHFEEQSQKVGAGAVAGAGAEPQITPEQAKEFEEFQEWKKSAKGSVEYQEFQEWKSYQKWRKTQKK